MTDTTVARQITGTTPAGKAARIVTVMSRDDGRVRVAIVSAQDNLLGDVRLTPAQARELATNLQNAATIAGLKARKAGAQ